MPTSCPNQLDLAAIDPARFTVATRAITFADGSESTEEFVLITPKKAMWQWADNELHLRSVLCRADGTIVSTGFPKFFNLGERPEADVALRRALDQGLWQAVLTPKLDGSLIVRAVIDGKVHLRTRGSFGLGEFHDRVLAVVRAQCPALLDPALGAGGDAGSDREVESQLFEYTSPNNQIVVRYGECALRQLAVVTVGEGRMTVHPAGAGGATWLTQHDGGPPSVFDTIDDAATVQDSESLARAVESMRLEKGHEGVVLWARLLDATSASGATALVKIKTDWYMQLHALRGEGSPKRMRHMIIQNDLRVWQDVVQYLEAYGVDWETAQMMRGGWDEATALREQVGHALDDALAEIEAWAAAHPPSAVGAKRDRTWRKALAQAARDIDHRAALRDGEGKKLSVMGILISAAIGDADKVREARLSLELNVPLPEVRRLLREAAGDETTGNGTK